MKIMGCDPSTWTGIVMLDDADQSVRKLLINFPDSKGYHRLQSIATAFDSLIEQWNPNVVFIESVALGNKGTLLEMMEIATVLRMCLFKRKLDWYNVQPTTLKKFTAGNGSAKKPEMAKAVEQKWGFVSQSDDVVDAFALAKLGQRYLLQPDEFPKGVLKWNLASTAGTSSKRSRSNRPKKDSAASPAKRPPRTRRMPSSA